MSLHPKHLELQSIVSLKYEGRTEYGTITQILPPGKRPDQKSGFTAMPGVRLSDPSAVVRIDLRAGWTAWDWRPLRDLEPIYMEHVRNA
jgi:hypothetical protein